MSELFYNYQKTKDHYFTNGQKMMQERNLRKASELFWGAITQSIKALASLSETSFRSHNDIRNYMREVKNEIKDEEIYTLFLSLEDLHRNFYDETIPQEDFPIYYKKVTLFLDKIDKLISNKLNFV